MGVGVVAFCERGVRKFRFQRRSLGAAAVALLAAASAAATAARPPLLIGGLVWSVLLVAALNPIPVSVWTSNADTGIVRTYVWIGGNGAADWLCKQV